MKRKTLRGLLSQGSKKRGLIKGKGIYAQRISCNIKWTAQYVDTIGYLTIITIENYDGPREEEFRLLLELEEHLISLGFATYRNWNKIQITDQENYQKAIAQISKFVRNFKLFKD